MRAEKGQFQDSFGYAGAWDDPKPEIRSACVKLKGCRLQSQVVAMLISV